MDVGLSTAIIHKQNISDLQFSSLYWVNILVSMILFALVILISPYLSIFYNEPKLRALLVIMGAGLIFSALGNLFRVLEEKDLNFKLLGVIDIIASMLSFGLAVILAKYGMGVFSLVWSTLVFILFRSVAFIVSGLRRKIKLLKFSFRETKTFYRTGGYYTAEQFVNYLSREIDILIIGKYFSPEMLGLYSLSKQLANRPTALVNPIFVKISAPIFSKLQAGNEFLKIGYRRLLNIIVAINTPIYMILFIFAKPITV